MDSFIFPQFNYDEEAASDQHRELQRRQLKEQCDRVQSTLRAANLEDYVLDETGPHKHKRMERQERLAEFRDGYRTIEREYERQGYGGTRRHKAVRWPSICIRIPPDLLKRLDAVAADAATNRSHLLRQLAADYMNSMDETGIRFSGCLLSVDKERKSPIQ